MTYRELFRLSYISLFLLISTLPVQSADKVLFGAKAVWNITLNLLGVGSLRHAEGARRTQPLIKEDNDMESSFAKATADRQTVSVNTDASSICNAAKALNDHFVDNRAEEEWQALRDQQALRQLNLSSRKGVAGSPEFWDRVDHPEKYDVNGRLITDHVYGFPNPNVKSSSPVLLTNAPVITKEIHKQATTVTATALVMMTQLTPVVSSQVPLIASISTEATKTRAVGDMLEMMNNPAPEVNPAMIAFLENGTMPIDPSPAVTGGAAVAAGSAVVAKKATIAATIAPFVPVIAEAALFTGVVLAGSYVMYKTGCFILDSLGVKPYTGPTPAQPIVKEQPLQNQKTVQNENNGNKKEDDGGPKKPKKDYSETVVDLAEKAKKAKDLADEVVEEAKKEDGLRILTCPKKMMRLPWGTYSIRIMDMTFIQKNPTMS